jgi:NitT/TauT family transport system substrate-binding protein
VHKKTFALAAAVMALGLSTAHAQEKVWKHGILEAKSDAGFIAMVDKGGFAAKRGLKVELLQIKAGATLMKALISGEIDSVDMGAAESIVAGVRGTGVKIVGCTWPGVPQVVLVKADIKSLADLKGKTVAISSPGSLPDLLFRGMLDAANVPFSDVKLATQGADLDRYKSLVAGITDAAVVSNEFEAVMPPDIKVLAKGGSAVPKFIRLCIATSSKVLAGRRDDLVKFVAAEMDAYKFAATHRDETIKVAHELMNAGIVRQSGRHSQDRADGLAHRHQRARRRGQDRGEVGGISPSAASQCAARQLPGAASARAQSSCAQAFA